MPSKKENQRKHAKRRMSGRFGFEADDTDIQRIIAAIQDGTAKFIRRDSKYKTVHELLFTPRESDLGETFSPILVWVCYDRFRKEIATFLRPGEDTSQDLLRVTL